MTAARGAAAATRRRELFDRYTTIDRIPHLQQRLDALDTWWRFANGDRIDVDRLGELVDILGSVAGDHGHYRWLADTVEQYCHDAAIHLPTLEPATPRHRNPRRRHRTVTTNALPSVLSRGTCCAAIHRRGDVRKTAYPRRVTLSGVTANDDTLSARW